MLLLKTVLQLLVFALLTLKGGRQRLGFSQIQGRSYCDTVKVTIRCC